MFRAITLLALLLAAQVHALSLTQISVVQGATDATSSQFSILHDKSQSLVVFAEDGQAGALYGARALHRTEKEFSPWAVTQVMFENLPPRRKFRLIVEDSAGRFIESRFFELLDLKQTQVRIAIASCLADYFYNEGVWQAMLESRPTMIFFIGDNVYGDRPNLITKRPADEKQLWERYVAGRLKYPVYSQQNLTPVLAVWDDHDYGTDNGDRTYFNRQASREIFEAFWAQQPVAGDSFQRGPGVASSFTAFGQQFLFLDGRYFRSAKSDPYQTPWGEEQESWLESALVENDKPTWLINGQQFFGGYRGTHSLESDYPDRLQWLLNLVRRRNAPVGFLSGDIHYSEFMRIEPAIAGYETIEITSSSLHSLTFPGQHLRARNPRRESATSAHNFVLLELRSWGQMVNGRATSMGSGGQSLFSELFLLNR